MKQGNRVDHKALGRGTVQPYVNFDNTKRREENYRTNGIVFVKLDKPPLGWPAVVQVDVEACKEVPGGIVKTNG